MMSQETTAPPKLNVENSWKDGGLFPLATRISPVVLASTTDESSDQAMSAEATNVAAAMAVLGQGKDFHSFIRCVCARPFDVHVERCVVQCVCDGHIKLTCVPLCACPPAFILILACFHSRSVPARPWACSSPSESLEQLKKQGHDDSSTSSSKNGSASDASPLPPNAPQSPGGTCPAHAQNLRMHTHSRVSCACPYAQRAPTPALCDSRARGCGQGPPRPRKVLPRRCL